MAATSAESKVAAVTLGFWVVKIAATTLGETGGDAVSMTLGLGYAISTVIFFAIFAAAVAAQIAARRFHPFLYWAVIVATTTAGTTMADFADRSLGLGYAGGVTILGALLGATLLAWWRVSGSVSVYAIDTRRDEMFYWATILFSNTLGTALGDFLADDGGLGYEGGSLVFGAALALVGAAYALTRSRGAGTLTHRSGAMFFWIAFILTRPLGATMGDLLTKPVPDGGLALSRIVASLVIAGFILAWITVVPQRPARQEAADASVAG